MTEGGKDSYNETEGHFVYEVRIKMFRNFWLGAVASSVVGWLLMGCSTTTELISSVGLRKVKVIAREDANGGRVTRMHFVFPKSNELLLELKKMDASTYFDQAEQLIANNPNDLEVVVVEAVPGLTSEVKIQLKDYRSKAALVFVDYDSNSRGLYREEFRRFCRFATVTLFHNHITIAY